MAYEHRRMDLLVVWMLRFAGLPVVGYSMSIFYDPLRPWCVLGALYSIIPEFRGLLAVLDFSPLPLWLNT